MNRYCDTCRHKAKDGDLIPCDTAERYMACIQPPTDGSGYPVYTCWGANPDMDQAELKKILGLEYENAMKNGNHKM